MSLLLTGPEKKEVEKDIVETALSEFERETITKEDLKVIAQFTIDGMKNIKTRVDLNSFLGSLSAKWSIFKGIASIEKGELTQMVESEVYSGALTLLKHGKIDTAIKLTQSVTN